MGNVLKSSRNFFAAKQIAKEQMEIKRGKVRAINKCALGLFKQT